MSAELINKTRTITEDMSFENALKAVLTGVEYPSEDFLWGLRLVPIFVKIGKANYDDLCRLKELATEFQQANLNTDIHYKTSSEYQSLLEGINSVTTFIAGVEFGQKLHAQEITDGLNK